MAPSQDRRSFLRWATHGLGALFAAILGFPVVCYLIDPRNRKGASSEFRLVDGVRLDDSLAFAQGPVQGVIRDVRVDGWTLHPNDVLGRVWVVQDAAAEGGFRVFTTICPHLGCSVNLGEGGFACPCHNARFDFKGDRKDGPAPRGMDSLEWQRNPADRDQLMVKYQNFKASIADKQLVGS